MRLLSLWCVLAFASLVAGCGGGSDSPRPAKATVAAATATPSPAPTFTAPNDIAACAQLEQAIAAISELISHTTEGITQALHPKDLAEKMGTAQRSLVDSAKLLAIVTPPEPLADSHRQLMKGLRMFAADFGRSKASAAKGDVQKASEQTVDEDALRKIQTSAKRIDDRCNA